MWKIELFVCLIFLKTFIKFIILKVFIVWMKKIVLGVRKIMFLKVFYLLYTIVLDLRCDFKMFLLAAPE